MDLATRLIAGLNAKPLERAGWWDYDPAPSAFLNHQPGEMRKPVVLDRVRQQPAGQIGSRTRPEGPKPETDLQFGRMAPSVPLRGGEVVRVRTGVLVTVVQKVTVANPWSLSGLSLLAACKPLGYLILQLSRG